MELILSLPKKFWCVWLSKLDNRKDYGEDRFLALGLWEKFVLLVVYTQRKNKIRLISARRANVEERRIYYGYIERRTIENPWSGAGF
jgi:uncharacterized DUF497 family protein